MDAGLPAVDGLVTFSDGRVTGEPGDTGPEEVRTVTPKGEPVEERITSIQAARAIYNKLISDATPETLRRRRLKGLIDGNPPFNSTRLAELGMGNRININSMEARAILDNKASAFFELFFEVPTLITVEPRYSGLEQQYPMLSQWCRIISEEYTTTLMDWPGFLVNMDKVRRESDAFGVGLMFWRDEWDWRPKAFSRGSFLPDPMAELDVDTLAMFTLRDKFTASELWQSIKNEGLAEKAGWDVDSVKRALVSVYVKGETQDASDPYQTSEWESLQQRLRNNDWSVQEKAFETVKVVHLCVKEVEKDVVSHYIFPEKPDQGRDEFLFRKTGRFGAMRHTLWWLPYNMGDSYLRSCRGLASMIEPHCDLSNRFLCQLFDAGFLTSSLIVQPKSEMDLSRLQMVRMGPITVLPSGLDAIQTSFTPKLSELVQLRDLSSSIMKNNTGVFRQNPELFAEREPQKTARQVVEEVAKEARVEKAGIAFDYAQLEKFYREVFRRLTNRDYITGKANYPGQAEAKDFIARCVVRGVPIDMLLHSELWQVKATKAIGMGSWGVKMDITNQLMNIRGLLDEVGQRNVLRDYLAVRVGQSNVNRYAQEVNRDTIPSNELGIAVLENNDMQEGSPIPVGYDQMHGIHEQAHRSMIAQFIQQLSGGDLADLPDVQRPMAALAVIIPHYAKTLELLSQDPSRKEVVQTGMDLIKQLQQIYQGLQKEAVRRAKQTRDDQQALGDALGQARQVVEDRNLQVKLQEIQGKLELERIKQDSLNQMRADKTQAQMDIRRGQAAADIDLRAQRQAAEIQMAGLKTQAEIDLARSKARPGGEER